MLRKNYSNNIEGSKAKRQEMSTFLQGIKNPNADTEKKLAEVLQGGKGETKRHYAVDESLYGTEEGVRLRKEAEEEQKRQKRKRDAKNRKDGKSTKDWKEELEDASMGGGSEAGAANGKRKKKSAAKAKGNKSNKAAESSESGKIAGIDTKQVAMITVVGALAAGIGFILGGNRSQ